MNISISHSSILKALIIILFCFRAQIAFSQIDPSSDALFKESFYELIETFEEEPNYKNFLIAFHKLEIGIRNSIISLKLANNSIDLLHEKANCKNSNLKVANEIEFLKQLIELNKGHLQQFYQNVPKITSNLLIDNNFISLAVINYSLGELSMQKRKFDEAKSYFLKNEDVFATKIRPNELDFLGNIFISNVNTIGYIHQKNKQYTEAEKYYKIALERAVQSNNQIWIGVIKGNIGYLEFLNGRPEKAKELLRFDIRNSIDKGDVLSAVIALRSLSNVYLKEKDLIKAKRYADSSEKVFQSYDDYEFKYNVTVLSLLKQRLLISIQEDEYEEVENQIEYVFDSIAGIIKNYDGFLSKKMLTRYAIEQKIQDADELEKENIKKNYLMIVFVLVFVALTIIVLILLNNRKNQIKFRKDLEEQKEALEDLNQEKNVLLSILSHDLRNPLNQLKGLLYLQEQNLLTQEEFQSMSQQIAESTNILLSMVDGLLAWVKNNMEEGIKLNMQLLKFEDVLSNVLREFKALMNEKNISVEVDIPEKLIVYADENALGTVLRNLISNAIKFSYTNSNIKINASELLNPNYIRINIEDQGLGIPKEKLDSLFKQTGRKVSTSGTNGEKGFGIGLQLCSSFLKKMGGHISVKSIQEKGSTFSVDLRTSR